MNQILPVPNPIDSYWLSEPHEFSNLRSTPDLPTECDIAIIGSGLAGIKTAYHILQESSPPPKVTILEARQLCSGATARNGGHCKVKTTTLEGVLPQLGPDGVDDLQKYVLRTIQEFKTIVEEEGLDCEFELRRSFDVQSNAVESESLMAFYDKSRMAGQKWTDSVSWVPPRNVEQVTSIKGADSATSTAACSLWPYKFATQLLARLVTRYPHHFNVQTTTPVMATASTEDGESIIETSRGTMKAKNLVFATNAYTAGLLPHFKDVIIPIRGMATHIVPQAPIHPHLSHTYNISFGPEKGVDYLNPRPDGSIVVGGGKWQYQNDRSSWFNNFDDSVRFDTSVQSYWENYMQRNFHGWEHSSAAVDKTWVGIMGITPDGWPHVGRVPGRSNQWMLAGFNGGGMAMIPMAAKAVAKMVRQDLGFEDVKEEFGLLGLWAASRERLQRGVVEEIKRRT